MADPDFEPLHSGDEDEDFIQDRRKKDGGVKRQKNKGGQLFKRSLDKKDRSSFEPVRPIAAPSPGKPIQRPVQGLVGPGDSQFGVSPPLSPSDEVDSFETRVASSASKNVANNAKTQFAGNPPAPLGQQNWTGTKDPESVRPQGQQLNARRAPNQGMQQGAQPAHVQKSLNQSAGHQIPQQMVLPLVAQPGMQQQHQHPQLPKTNIAPQPPQSGPREDKLTLLAKAKLYQAGGTSPGSPVGQNQQTFGSVTETPKQRTPSVSTPPRVSSPVDGGPPYPQAPTASPPVNQPPLPDRQVQWSANESNSPRAQQKENWADFSKKFSDSLDEPEDSDDQQRHRSSSYSSAGSSSSADESDGEESVWKITEEQRDYYTKQFKKLQPTDGGVIKGAMARDFFLKSGLPTETLSRIWHLSDLNKDHALDLEEFCIAMHLVVAVRHGIELPPALPSLLLPRIEGLTTTSMSSTPNEGSSTENLTADEQLQSPGWANFDSGADANDKDEPQTTSNAGWNASTNNATTDDAANVRGQPSAEESQGALPRHPKHQSLSHSFSIGHSPSHRAADKLPSKKLSIEIARPRAMGGLVNLMDLGPGQLLPPPGGKKGRAPGKPMMAVQGMPSPLTSPTGPNVPDHRVTSSQSDLSDSDIVKVRRKTEPTLDKISDRSLTQEGEVSKSNEEAIEKSAKEERWSVVLEAGKEKREGDDPKLRRSSSRKSRPRSYTGDSRSSVELDHLTDQGHDLSGDLGHPPTPPPRAKKGHSRASSLDLNKLLGTKGGQLFEDTKPGEEAGKRDLSPPKKPPRTSIYKADQSPEREASGNEASMKPAQEQSTKSIVRVRPAPTGGRQSNANHRRSASLDWGKEHAVAIPPPKAGDGKDAIPKLYPKRAAPNPPQLKSRAKSEERGLSSRIPASPEDAEQPRLPSQPGRPLERKMRKHELQARIRLLKEKNSSLASINNELNQELRQIMENRTILELKTEKLRQSFNK